MSEPHRMYETQYAIQGAWGMKEFTGKHSAVCRRIFKDRSEAERNGPIYLQEVVDLSVFKSERGESLFSLTMEGAKFFIIEVDVEKT